MMRTITEENVRDFHDFLLREEKSPVTVEKYVRDIRTFFVFAGEAEIAKETTVSYKKQLVAHGYAVASINSMLASLNNFLDFMGWQDCKVKHIRVQKQTYCPEEKELSKEEYLRLLEAAKGERRIYLIMQTICATGIRISELKYFTVEALRRGEITVNCKSKTRTILVPGKLKKKLLEYVKKCGITQGAVFVTKSGNPMDRSYIWAKMKKLCAAAKVNPSKVFPHNLRKLFARTFYSLEKDIAKLADILGHGSIETTRIYIMTTGNEHRRKLERLGLVI